METKSQITEFENKIERLKVKFNVELEVAKLLGDVKNSLIGDDPKTWFLSCTPKTKAELITIFKKLKPAKENRIIKTCNNSQEIESPFKIELINPCAPNQYNNFSLKIVYKCSKGFDVWIIYTIDEIKEFLKTSQRNITSSEYHYFIGISQRKLNEMVVKMYLFDVDRSKYLNMYGGNQYLLDVEMINKIIEKLTK